MLGNNDAVRLIFHIQILCSLIWDSLAWEESGREILGRKYDQISASEFQKFINMFLNCEGAFVTLRDSLF